MNKEILKQLKLTLDKVNKKAQKQKENNNKLEEIEQEKIYCAVWKLILNEISKKESVTLDIFVRGEIIFLKIGDKIKKTIRTKKIKNFGIIEDKLKHDGLHFLGATRNKMYRIYVSREDLKNILETKDKVK